MNAYEAVCWKRRWKQEFISCVSHWLNVLSLPFIEPVRNCAFMWKHGVHLLTLMSCGKNDSLIWELKREQSPLNVNCCGNKIPWIILEDCMMASSKPREYCLSTFFKLRDLFNNPLPSPIFHDSWLSWENMDCRPSLSQEIYLITLSRVGADFLFISE